MGAAAEPPTRRVSLLTNGVTWYLRSSLDLESGRVRVTTPRTFLGFVPFGTKRLEMGAAELQHISLGAKLYPERLIAAVALGLLAVFGNFTAVGTVLAAVGGVAMLLLSFIAVIRIEGAGRRPFIVPVCLAHLPRARRFTAGVERAAAMQSEARS
jgi:hypothetical protein